VISIAWGEAGQSETGICALISDINTKESNAKVVRKVFIKADFKELD
tara:strand:- start:315 stop:455 length:141 start_codon:yes stop_codon:yes gene_type:complete